MPNQPWISGPREILQHGLTLLHKDSDVGRRLALIAIDNAVELTIKTFLGLPKRITGINIPRRQFAEISESFPRLLDALEEHADMHLDGIDLGEIEWFHRLRNQLYHQGNGLTVERIKVEIYAELARLLFSNLFAEELDVSPEDQHVHLGAFLSAWVSFEKVIGDLLADNYSHLEIGSAATRPPMMMIKRLIEYEVIDKSDADDIGRLRKLRNEVVHGMVDPESAISKADIDQLAALSAKYKGKKL